MYIYNILIINCIMLSYFHILDISYPRFSQSFGFLKKHLIDIKCIITNLYKMKNGHKCLTTAIFPGFHDCRKSF